MPFDKEMCNPQHDDRSMRNPTQLPRQRRSANSDKQKHFLHADTDRDGKTGRSSSAQRNRQRGPLPRMKRQDSGFYGSHGVHAEKNSVRSSSNRSSVPSKRQNPRRTKLGQNLNSLSSNDSSTRSSSDSSRSSLESIGTEKTCATTSSSIVSDTKPDGSSVSSRRSRCSLTSSNFVPQNDLLRVRRRPLKKPHRQASDSRLDLNPERRPRNVHSTSSSRLHSSMPNFSHSDLTHEPIMEVEEEEAGCSSSELQFISLPFVLTQKHIKIIEDRRSKKLTSRCMVEISEKLNIPLFYSSSRGFEFVPNNMSDTQAITNWLSGNAS